MGKRDRVLNLVLVVLAVVLVLLVIFGLVRTGVSGGINRSVSEEETVIAEANEQNDIDVNAALADADAEEAETVEAEEAEEEESKETNDNTITDTGSAYEAMTFSDEVTNKLDGMTTEQKVAQLFVTTPEELTGIEGVTVAGETTQSAVSQHPVGGIVYSSSNLNRTEQADSLVSSTQDYMEEAVGVPMFAMVEELGGREHSPLINITSTIVTPESPAALGEEGDPDAITASAQQRAEYIKSCGFNTILGPVADVSTDGAEPDFDEITYGSNTGNVAECVERDVEGVQSEGVMAVMRAFPGTYEVTGDYSAYQVGIDAGVDCIMVSNLPDSDLTDEGEMPCSISIQVAQTLRQDMGFDGVLMTSDLASEAVTGYCSTAEAVVQALNAGMDLIYVRSNFNEAYDAVLAAVQDGSISDNVLNNAVGRILTEKME